MTPEEEGAGVVEARGCSDSRRGQEPRNPGSLQKLEKARDGFCLRASRRTQPC